MPMIKCKRCKQSKDDIEFLEANGIGRGPGGRFLWCRDCRDKYLTPLNELKQRLRKNQKEAPLARLHRDEMLKVERARRRISEITGIQHHVEHVVPLSSERSKRPICGLHVPWNVSLASAALNMSKGAKFSEKDAERVERDHMAWLKARGLALVFALLFSFPACAQTTELTGIVTHVRDGDTIEVQGVAIHLNGLSAPERNQPFGPDATAFMNWMVLEREVTCELNGERNRDRLIGVCFYQGVDIARLIIREGYALDCPRYSKGRYAEDEALAKDSGIKDQYSLPKYCR
jgi:micrococcal nuclease